MAFPDVVLVADRLSYSYGQNAGVREVSFQIRRGEVVGLLGPSGSGKTTILRMVVGLLTPHDGRVAVLGQPPHRARRRIGYLPENIALDERLPPRAWLGFLAALNGVPRSAARERIRHWMDRLGLPAAGRAPIRTFSYGMKRRLQFIGAILHAPDLIVLDEPFQGLDPIWAHEMLRAIEALRQAGAAVLLSTHQLNLAERICDAVVFIFRGRILQSGPMEEIRRPYTTPILYVRADRLPDDLPGLARAETHGPHIALRLEEGADLGITLRALLDHGIQVEAIERPRPSLEEVFIAAVERSAPAPDPLARGGIP